MSSSTHFSFTLDFHYLNLTREDIGTSVSAAGDK